MTRGLLITFIVPPSLKTGPKASAGPAGPQALARLERHLGVRDPLGHRAVVHSYVAGAEKRERERVKCRGDARAAVGDHALAVQATGRGELVAQLVERQ